MKDELLFCPLGGSGEIGMNMNLFGYGQPSDHKWIMVDIGVTFADDTIPGVDLIYPCLLYTSPSPRDATLSRMPSSA